MRIEQRTDRKRVGLVYSLHGTPSAFTLQKCSGRNSEGVCYICRSLLMARKLMDNNVSAGISTPRMFTDCVTRRENVAAVTNPKRRT